MNDEEIKQIENLYKEIDNKINILNQLKNDIKSFFDEMKSIKENKRIYEMMKRKIIKNIKLIF